MNRRDFLNFLGKGFLVTSFSPLILKGVEKINNKPLLSSTIFPSKLDKVVLHNDLNYELLVTWGEKISSKDRFGFNNDYIGFIKGKNRSEVIYGSITNMFIHCFSSKAEKRH